MIRVRNKWSADMVVVERLQAEEDEKFHPSPFIKVGGPLAPSSSARLLVVPTFSPSCPSMLASPLASRLFSTNTASRLVSASRPLLAGRRSSSFFATRPLRPLPPQIPRTLVTMSSPTVKLNSGYEMPLVGFGLWKVDNATCADTVYNAIKAGYRLFDGACGT